MGNIKDNEKIKNNEFHDTEEKKYKACVDLLKDIESVEDVVKEFLKFKFPIKKRICKDKKNIVNLRFFDFFNFSISEMLNYIKDNEKIVDLQNYEDIKEILLTKVLNETNKSISYENCSKEIAVKYLVDELRFWKHGLLKNISEYESNCKSSFYRNKIPVFDTGELDDGEK